jgi:Domain of Unknown Function (DUF1080)
VYLDARIMLERLSVGLLVTVPLLPLGLGSAAQPAPGTFTPLFNGRDLTGWRPDPASGWRVVDGAVVHEGTAGAVLASERELGDLELQGELQTEAGAQAAVLLRGAGLLTIKVNPGVTHKLSIAQVGERTTVVIDGETFLPHQRVPNVKTDVAPLPATGPLVLSAKGGGVRWRSLAVRPIGADEARTRLAGRDDAGFASIFNGRDFDGWAGPIENYEVQDGAIVCKPGSGGTIFTKNQYSDFVVRLEFKLPPGGNNGLAIRYPGEGDAAYVGMAELQVLDDTSGKYATLDPRQFHGSAYGMVAAHKGYLRPVGEWNFQEVTVRGSKITVELNGTRILDADLSTVKDFHENRPHPGKDRASGHFGFAGHGDAVQFRNIRIKTLNQP